MAYKEGDNATTRQLWLLNKQGWLVVSEERGRPVTVSEADAAIKRSLGVLSDGGSSDGSSEAQ